MQARNPAPCEPQILSPCRSQVNAHDFIRPRVRLAGLLLPKGREFERPHILEPHRNGCARAPLQSFAR